MKIKRLKKIRIGAVTFKIKWNKQYTGGSFNYPLHTIEVGCRNGLQDTQIFGILCHEIFEVCAVEMNVRLQRPDCESDYIFVFDHRQYETLMEMYVGIISEFLE